MTYEIDNTTALSRTTEEWFQDRAEAILSLSQEGIDCLDEEEYAYFLAYGAFDN